MDRNTSCQDLFGAVNDRMVNALMLHDHLANLFDFMGLHGFKRIHEYQYFVESAERRSIERYFINHHNKLLKSNNKFSEPAIIPTSWVNYSRHDITPQVRKEYVEKSFMMYREWEHETKEFYENIAKIFMEKTNIADFNKINELVKDVDMELKYLDRLIIKLKAVNFDNIYIQAIQDDIHEEYKGKTKEIGISMN